MVRGVCGGPAAEALARPGKGKGELLTKTANGPGEGRALGVARVWLKTGHGRNMGVGTGESLGRLWRRRSANLERAGALGVVRA